jgi:hypothetical protein
VNTLALDRYDSNNIYVGGVFKHYDDISCNYIAQLSTLDGSLNTTFYSGTGFDDPVNALAINNNIYVGGAFKNYDGSYCKRIVRLTKNGTIDSNFNTGYGFDAPVNTLALDPFNNILVGGAFNQYDGSACSYVLKLNSDGMINQDFYTTMGGGFNAPVNALALDNIGNTIVGGKFTHYKDVSCNYIIKLGKYYNQGSYAIALGYDAGKINQGLNAIALGSNAASSNQGSYAIAMGSNSGSLNQGSNAIAMGAESGGLNQGNYAIAIGMFAGNSNQGSNAIAMGINAGINDQRNNAIAMGANSGCSKQGNNAIAIGMFAGHSNQGSNAIALGYYAGYTGQASNTIILNATGSKLNGVYDVSNAFYVAPIRQVTVSTTTAGYSNLYYTENKEIVVGVPKSFVIPHPVDKAKYLVHACLEGPEAGVYYRGNAIILPETNYTEITLPHYVSALATEFTVHVTPKVEDDDELNENMFIVLVSSAVKNGKFKVYREKKNSFTCNFNYLVIGKRLDVNVEPLTSSVNVKGSGPYTWI